MGGNKHRFTRIYHANSYKAQKFERRGSTLVTKSKKFAADFGVHVYMLIEDKNGVFYEHKTKKDPNWPPPNPVSLSNTPSMSLTEILQIAEKIELHITGREFTEFVPRGKQTSEHAEGAEAGDDSVESEKVKAPVFELSPITERAGLAY